MLHHPAPKGDSLERDTPFLPSKNSKSKENARTRPHGIGHVGMCLVMLSRV